MLLINKYQTYEHGGSVRLAILHFGGFLKNYRSCKKESSRNNIETEGAVNVFGRPWCVWIWTQGSHVAKVVMFILNCCPSISPCIYV